MSNKEIMKDFMELFPVEGHVVPYIELKFRLASKYGADELDEILKKMVDKNILNRFEFNNSVHYKAKTEIPVSLSTGGATPSSPPVSNDDQLTDLSKLVIAIAKKSDDPEITNLLTTFTSKYNL